MTGFHRGFERWGQRGALVGLMALSGCVSVGDHVARGQASLTAGDVAGARAELTAALDQARDELKHEHYLHLQRPRWVTFTDACLAYAGFLDRTEGMARADQLDHQCLEYAAGMADSAYFTALVAARVEVAWAARARARGLHAPALAHLLNAEVLRSAIGRKDSPIVVRFGAERLQSATAMFASMDAAHSSWVADQKASGMAATSSLDDTAQQANPAQRVSSTWQAIDAAKFAPKASSIRYRTLLDQLPDFDRAVGARLALAAFPGIEGWPEAGALLTRARVIEAAGRRYAPIAMRDLEAFQAAWRDFQRWLGPSAGE